MRLIRSFFCTLCSFLFMCLVSSSTVLRRALAAVVLLLMPLAALISYQVRLRDSFDGVWCA